VGAACRITPAAIFMVVLSSGPYRATVPMGYRRHDFGGLQLKGGVLDVQFGRVDGCLRRGGEPFVSMTQGCLMNRNQPRLLG
jgi:hypothetical protein